MNIRQNAVKRSKEHGLLKKCARLFFLYFFKIDVIANGFAFWARLRGGAVLRGAFTIHLIFHVAEAAPHLPRGAVYRQYKPEHQLIQHISHKKIEKE